MGWGKEWPVVIFKELSKEEVLQKWPVNEPLNIKPAWVKDAANYPIVKARELNNLKPTHDPYTNPGAMVYYECGCGATLDPKTKSFAQLNNAASVAGWKIRWKQSGEGYQPFCVKCGEGVE